MATDVVRPCRSCGGRDVAVVLDLGPQPIADIMPRQGDIPARASTFPLRLGVCPSCWLVQLTDDVEVRAGVHGHGARYSTSVTSATNAWLDELTARLGLGPGQVVGTIGDAAGDLATRFAALGVRATALDHVAAGRVADLIVAHHALAHVDQLDQVIRTISAALAPRGAAAIEFHDVLGVVAGGQFDIACHAHRSYLSLTSLTTALERHGLTIQDAVRVDTYGGSIRAIVRHRATAERWSITATGVQPMLEPTIRPGSNSSALRSA